ncbi:MAG: AAA family ATPase [candidate division WOR-3 bacterium]
MRLLFKNYKLFAINLFVFLSIAVFLTILQKTYKTYISEIKIFSEPIQTESKNLLPYLYNYSSDDQNNYVIIADIMSRDLIEAFIRKYNYNFKIISKEPKNMEIYEIVINKPLKENEVYKVQTNTIGEIQIKSSVNGSVELIGLNLYDAFENFLRNLNIRTYTLDEMIGNKKQSNVLGFGEPRFKIISISLYSSEPFINNVARKFKDYIIEYNLNKKIARFKNSKEFISKQIENYLAELDNLNYKIKTTQIENNVFLDEKNPFLNELLDIKKKQTSLLFEIQSLNDWLKNSKDENEIVTSDPFIQNAIKDIILFKDTLNLLLVRYGSNSSEYLALYNAYQKLRDNLNQKISERIKNLQSQLELLRKSEEKLRNEINTKFEIEKEAISVLSRKKAIEDIITLLFQRMEEIKIQESEIIPDFKILEFTEKPYISVKGRNWLRNITFAVLFSLFLSTMLILISEYTSTNIKNLDDIGLRLNIQKAYLVPEIADTSYMPINILRERDYKKILEGHVYLESFRIIALENDLHNINCLFGITSSIQGEGKSFISINLASAIAMMNKRVIILDCDIRKGDVTKMIERELKGLSDIYNLDNFENIIHPYLENLYIVPKGLTFIDPIAIFSSKLFDEFLTYLKNHFDVIILDLPPILRVAETHLIIEKLKYLLFVIKLNYSPLSIVKDAISKIPPDKIKVYIANGFDLSSSYGYKQKYYYKLK